MIVQLSFKIFRNNARVLIFLTNANVTVACSCGECKEKKMPLNHISLRISAAVPHTHFFDSMSHFYILSEVNGIAAMVVIFLRICDVILGVLLKMCLVPLQMNTLLLMQ